MTSISIIDQPITFSSGDKISSMDLLKTSSYANALAEFAMKCSTPLTIGIQGEWGSGKTSLLNMMKENISRTEIPTRGRAANLKGDDVYRSVWINTWEHSLLKTPEECLLSIIEEIIDSIAIIDGSWNTAQKAKSALKMLAKGAVRVGATAALGNKGGQVADEMIGNGDSNSIKSLRSSLDQAIIELVSRSQNPVQRFIIFIDDLDRLEPPTAVMVLELLKNIFNIEHCVFIIAIDYQVVVKGLKEKFGEQTEHNEWEFRAFFDKIIQLPFMMPMAAYDITNYVEGLLEDITFFSRSEMKVMKDSKLSEVVRMTLGANPRALKRLINSLSLILLHRNMNNKKNDDKNEMVVKQLLVALVCFQISFPKLYELLVHSPLFYTWDDSFVNQITGGPHQENKEVAIALTRAVEIHEEDFDEDWEQALFKVVWINGWQKNRLVEASRTLSLILDKILPMASSEEEKEKLLKEALKMTVVTSVASSDDILFSTTEEIEEDDSLIQKVSFWRELKAKLTGTQCCFDKVKIRPTYSNQYLTATSHKVFPERIKFITSSSTSMVFKIETYTGDLKENYELFSFIKRYRSTLEEATGVRPQFKLSPERTTQSIHFGPPNEIQRRLKLLDNDNKMIKDTIFEWLAENTKKIEAILEGAILEFESRDDEKAEEKIVDKQESSPVIAVD